MPVCSVRSLQICLGLILMLWLGDRPIQAQTSPLVEMPAEAEIVTDPSQPVESSPEMPVESVPNPNQPIESSPEVPSDPKPVEEAPPRKLKNFVGIGSNIGISGSETGLSAGAAALITKRDLNDWLSIRGVTTLFSGERNDRTIALTVNFPIRSESKKVLLVPYVGGGALISSKNVVDDLIIRGLVTGGIDLPITRRISATTSVNVGFADEPQVGVQIGVGFNF
jgi:hypothetical protein